jgi:hypothetical protein
MPNPWTYGSNSLDTLRLSHKDNNIILIILYKHYASKFSELKNQLPKLRFEILLIIQQFVTESIRYYDTLLLEKQSLHAYSYFTYSSSACCISSKLTFFW